jgi:hypothetical protein
VACFSNHSAHLNEISFPDGNSTPEVLGELHCGFYRFSTPIARVAKVEPYYIPKQNKQPEEEE